MKSKLTLAAAALLVLSGLMLWRITARSIEDREAAEVPVKLPKLKRDDIDELVLSSSQHPKVRLVRKEQKWWLAEPLEALADQKLVSTALNKLEQLEITRLASNNAKHYQLLQVDDRDSTRVIARRAGKTLLDLHLGEVKSGGTMLRIHGQGPVALAEGTFRYMFHKRVTDWRERSIVKADASKVQEVIAANRGGTFHFVREAGGWKQRVGIGDEAIEQLDVTKVEALVITAASLGAQDFVPAGYTPEHTGLTPDAPSVWLKIASNVGEEEIRYRIGKKTETPGFYLQREGDDQIYEIPYWVGERFVPSKLAFVKEQPAPATANGSENAEPAHAQKPPG